jgi:c-di-GMP-binding flagellar brake protein YcgR
MDLTILTAIRPGDKLEIHYINKLNEDVILDTLTYDVLSETEFQIHNPLMSGKLYMIPMNVQVTVFSRRENYGVIMFTAHLIRRMKIGNVYTIQAKVVSELQKQQRRSFFRVRLYQEADCYIMVDKYMNPVDYYIFDPDAVEEEQVNMKMTLLDLSGGGIGLKSNVPLPLGTYIYSYLRFIDEEPLYGKVVRCIASQQYEGEYELGINFDELSNDVRRSITSFVFNKQQQTRRKEINSGEN